MAGAKIKETGFKIPRYLRLNRGSMWFDVDGDNASGAKLYAIDVKFIGRGRFDKENDVPKDKFGNQNFITYGYVDASDLPWYVDTNSIPAEKMSRIILAYKNGILVEADPKNPPVPDANDKQKKEFKYNEKGERVFIGQNKEMYKKLQNLNFDDLRKFVMSFPKNEDSKNNLIDLFHYEQKGYNRLARPRLEVLDLIRTKLKEYGPSMSAIRVNED